MVKLEDYTHKELKAIVRKYNKHVSFKYSKLNKKDLIEGLRNEKNLQITETDKGIKIKIVDSEVGDMDKEQKKRKPKPKKPEPKPKEPKPEPKKPESEPEPKPEEKIDKFKIANEKYIKIVERNNQIQKKRPLTKEEILEEAKADFNRSPDRDNLMAITINTNVGRRRQEEKFKKKPEKEDNFKEVFDSLSLDEKINLLDHANLRNDKVSKKINDIFEEYKSDESFFPILDEFEKLLPDTPTKLNAFYFDLDKAGSSRRSQTQFIKKYGRDILESIFGGRDFGDFFSTPIKCMKQKKIVDSIKNNKKVLEGSAGLGSIINFIRNIDRNIDIVGIELNKKYVEFLKENFKYKTEIIGGDYFEKTKPYMNKNDFDMIFMNPPFSRDYPKKDGKFYMNFFFRNLKILNNSSRTYEKDMIFISPSIDNFEKNKGIQMSNIIKSLNKIKFNEIYKENFGKEPKKGLREALISNDEEGFEEEVEEFNDEFGFDGIQELDECKGFGGTSLTAKIYLVNLF